MFVTGNRSIDEHKVARSKAGSETVVRISAGRGECVEMLSRDGRLLVDNFLRLLLLLPEKEIRKKLNNFTEEQMELIDVKI